MTGKDILNEEFERAGMRGYRAEQVDLFLNTVATYVDEVNSKNEDLSYKLKILADKIEEYKKDESSIRDALLGAQKLASSVIEEANKKAETLTREAQSAAEEMLGQAKNKIESLTKESLQKANAEINAAKRKCESEQRLLDNMKHEVSAFRSSILKQYKSHLDLLSNLPSIPLSEQKSEPVSIKQEFVQETIADIKSVPASESTASQPQPVNSIFDTAPIPDVKTKMNTTPIPKANLGNTISYTKVVIEEDTSNKVTDVKEEITQEKQVEYTLESVNDQQPENEQIPKVETIKSDILATEEDIKQEIRLQTKEFHSSGRKSTIVASEINDRGTVSAAIPFNPPKKSAGSMAGKFAELDFGKNKE